MVQVAKRQCNEHTDETDEGNVGGIMGSSFLQYRYRIQVLGKDSPQRPTTQMEDPKEVWPVFYYSSQFHENDFTPLSGIRIPA